MEVTRIRTVGITSMVVHGGKSNADLWSILPTLHKEAIAAVGDLCIVWAVDEWSGGKAFPFPSREALVAMGLSNKKVVLASGWLADGPNPDAQIHFLFGEAQPDGVIVVAPPGAATGSSLAVDNISPRIANISALQAMQDRLPPAVAPARAKAKKDLAPVQPALAVAVLEPLQGAMSALHSLAPLVRHQRQAHVYGALIQLAPVYARLSRVASQSPIEEVDIEPLTTSARENLTACIDALAALVQSLEQGDPLQKFVDRLIPELAIITERTVQLGSSRELTGIASALQERYTELVNAPGMVALTGTPKQVAWANRIREKQLHAIEQWVAGNKDPLFAQLRRQLVGVRESRFWIDYRELTPYAVLLMVAAGLGETAPL